jgi:hypothetical protein
MKNKNFIIVSILIIAVLLGYFYARIGVDSSPGTFTQNKQTVVLSNDSAVLNLDLKKDSYLLRVHYDFKEGREKEIYFNGVKLSPTVKIRGLRDVNYVILPGKIVNEGENLLSIDFLKDHPNTVVVKIKNYYFSLFNSVYVLLPDSANLGQGSGGFSVGRYRVVVKKIFLRYLSLVFLSLVCLILFIKEAISVNLKKNLLLKSNPYKDSKIERIGKIILFGFIASVLFHLIKSAFLGFHYPNNTFLFDSGNRFNDFLNPYALAKTQGYFQVSSYYALANIIFYGFSFLPIPESLIIFLGFFLCSFFYICASNLNMADRNKYLKSVFIFTCLSYPLLFAVDRGNMEIFLFVFLYLCIYFFTIKRFMLSVIFLTAAIGMKGYPIIFLVLFLSEKRYKELFLAFFLLGIGVLTAWQLNILNWSSILSGVNLNSYHFLLGNNIVQRGVSLYSLMKLFFIQFNVISSVNMAAFLSNYLKIISCFFIVLSGYVIFVEKEFWKKVALLTFAMLLFPHISADYKLLYIFIPLFLFINTQKKDAFSPFYTIMFGLLLIPKDYYIFPKVVSANASSDISIAVVLNILIMLAMIVVIIAGGLFSNKQIKPSV